eukprot:15440321-Alexandrium_andersonii.AAC.1
MGGSSRAERQSRPLRLRALAGGRAVAPRQRERKTLHKARLQCLKRLQRAASAQRGVAPQLLSLIWRPPRG